MLGLYGDDEAPAPHATDWPLALLGRAPPGLILGQGLIPLPSSATSILFHFGSPGLHVDWGTVSLVIGVSRWARAFTRGTATARAVYRRP